MTLIELSKQIYADNVAKGYDTKCNALSRLLILSEVTEAIEALRKNKISEVEEYRRLKNEEFDRLLFEMYIKGTLVEELADIVIRCLDFTERFKVDIDGPASTVTLLDSFNIIIKKTTEFLPMLKSSEDEIMILINECISGINNDNADFVAGFLCISPIIAYCYDISPADLEYVICEKIEYNKLSLKKKF